MGAGRPLSPLDLSEGWKDRILNLYRVGASDVEVMAMIWEERGTFSKDLFKRWIKEEEEFSTTIKMGRLLCQTWWEKEGRTNLKTKEFQPALYQINMRNRFKWNSKDPDRDSETTEDRYFEEPDGSTPSI